MKTQLIIYGVLIVAFIAYNLIDPIENEKTDFLINTLFSSAIFLYVAYIAFQVLRKIGKKSK